MVRRTFSALSVRNFRLFIFGQLVSLSGTSMQTIAQALLVLQLTGQGTASRRHRPASTPPRAVARTLGGVIADRFEKRTILYCTQTTAAVLALILGVLVATDTVQLWMVYVLAAGLGTTTALDAPVRQTFRLRNVSDLTS